jgi:RNA polymerase sigma-70 factor (ECF subfamily)
VSTESVSDSALVERARAGDTAAFGELVDRHRRAVYRAALAALRSSEDAEEVAQEAFISAYQHLPGFRDQASFKTWLLSIAWRKALTRRRSVRSLMRRFVSPDPDSGWEAMDAGRTQEQTVLNQELRDHLRRLVAGLAPKFRDALLLSASGDHTYDEIAAMLGTPVGTAKWRVAEARRHLKVKLAKLGYGHG